MAMTKSLDVIGDTLSADLLDTGDTAPYVLLAGTGKLISGSVASHFRQCFVDAAAEFLMGCVDGARPEKSSC